MMNEIYIMRHGQSVANVNSVISSRMAANENDYGLTYFGREEVKRNIEQFSEIIKKEDIDKISIYCSPFLRTKQTAQIVKEVLSCETVICDERLSERDFGMLELKSSTNYEKVWYEDQRNIHHEKYDVESVKSVLNRSISFIKDLDNKDSNKIYFICTHGDVASILISGILNKDIRLHRKNAPLLTSQICKVLVNLYQVVTFPKI